MRSTEESLASWGNIVATALTVLGLIQSRNWLIGVSALLFTASIIGGLYGRRERRLVKSAEVAVEGLSIDSLNVANLRRRLNRSLVVQEVQHVARIEGEDLRMTWRYDGYCRAPQETMIEFSIDSDNRVPFEALECFAYDLRRDPGRNHKIQPILLGTDGISKRIAVPFLEPLAAQEAFSLFLECDLPGCMKPGLEYYTSTASLGHEEVGRSTVRLVFAGQRPEWVRVYECDASGNATLLKDMGPARQAPDLTEYLDVVEGAAAQSARIYMFWRARAARNDPSTTDTVTPE